MRYLTEGSLLTPGEQEDLRDLLCPWRNPEAGIPDAGVGGGGALASTMDWPLAEVGGRSSANGGGVKTEDD
jgi:hypothetical protein